MKQLMAVLIYYVRFVDFSNQKLVEELLFCKPIELGCREIDLFNIIDNFISKNNLDWEKCISLCTDGTKAMSGSCSGSVFLQHLLNLQLKFKKYFPENLSSYKRICRPFAQPTLSSFTEQEKEDYLDLTCDNSQKRKFNLVNPTNFWIPLNNEYSALTKKALQMFILFAMSYLCEAGLSAMAVIKSKYRSRINVEKEMRGAVSKIFPRFEDVAKTSKPTHHIK